MKSTSPAYFVSSSAYDQRLGQFLSADPLVQDPTNSQNYNRYAYCFNNPLKYTDPSGYRISGNNNYWGQDGDYSSNMNYYIDGVRVSPSEYRAYGGAGTTEFHGNINWSGPGGGYYMVDFQREESSSMVTIAIHYSFKVLVTPDDHDEFVSGQNSKPYYDVYEGDIFKTFQKPMGNQFTSNANPFSDGYVLGAFNSDGIYGQIINPHNAQIVNDISEPVGLSTDAASLFVGNTKIGGNLAYKMAYNSTLVKGMNCLKPLGYIAAGAGFATDIYLSMNIDPKTGEPYQSWGETGLNTAVTIGAMAIGGWWGLGLGVYYYGCKSYIKTIQEHPDWAPQRVSPAFLH